ncbi:diguanylate cyclase [Halothiobacillus sp. DCM-1]|uniref:diguanylate cyclase n=1 Tax=Halothiobacillus sp. DCM-1 TaxID=3112558 RepID=UPI003248A9DB
MNSGYTCNTHIRHDLRTPLNHLIGYTEMLQEDLPPACANLLDDRLNRLLNDAHRMLDTINRPTPLPVGHFDALFPDWREKMALLEMDFHALSTTIEQHWQDACPDIEKIRSAVGHLRALLENLSARPAVDLSETESTPRTGSPSTTPVADGHILIIDDRTENLELMQRRLMKEGYRVTLANTGQDALARLETDTFDVVMLDWLMPDMSGAEVLAKIRSKFSQHELPVIVVTARHGSDMIVDALTQGANDYLAKPLDFPEARARLATQVYLRKVTQQLAEANRQLKQFSYIDGLTAIANRRKFDEYLLTTWRRAQQEGAPVSLILLDVDFFKRYNDTLGHEAGDQALMRVAKAISTGLFRVKDLAARYGGEEFAVILPETALEDALGVAERLREQIQSLNLPHPAGTEAGVVTASLGVSEWRPTAFCEPSALISLADKGLYQAKSAGRNRVGTLGGNYPG